MRKEAAGTRVAVFGGSSVIGAAVVRRAAACLPAGGSITWVTSLAARRSTPSGAALANEAAATTPLGRMATADDVADAVVAVMMSPFVTGAVRPCDGGRHL